MFKIYAKMFIFYLDLIQVLKPSCWFTSDFLMVDYYQIFIPNKLHYKEYLASLIRLTDEVKLTDKILITTVCQMPFELIID